MEKIISTIHILVSVLLVAAIIIQAKGTGLGSAFGGSGKSYRSKRGFEKILFTVTIVLAFLFFLTSIANILV